ncbi:MAG TPA: hypothetical protein VGO98_01695 [Candidatus Saccharimonadales bacterium]|jgi:hypothetical protein|nr:hypothetical protein [Candidatus Saccharimonadales bacterium]
MGDYGIIGVLLIFVDLIFVSFILLRTHSIKVVLDDKDLKRAMLIIRLRNIAMSLGIVAVSFYLLLSSGIQSYPPGSAVYISRASVASYMIYAGVALLITAAYLAFIGGRPEFNFEQSLQRYVVKEKLRASFKFRQKPRSRRMTRV